MNKKVIEFPVKEKPHEDTGRTGLGPENWLLIIGAAIIVVSVGYTSVHLYDRTVFAVLIPGVVLGLVLVGFSGLLRKRGEKTSNKRGVPRRENTKTN